jgi:hypothetical protein
MPGKRSRRLVIDASVAAASGGEEATDPTAKHCRDFLRTVLGVCHRMVMTREISEEWKSHQSSFARAWRVSMEARKKVEHLDIVPNAAVHTKIENAATDEKKWEEMRKDMHLVDAALETVETVVSLDEEARGLFSEAAKSVGQLRGIVWVNPDRPDEKPIQWLERGAKSEERRRLG